VTDRTILITPLEIPFELVVDEQDTIIGNEHRDVPQHGLVVNDVQIVRDVDWFELSGQRLSTSGRNAQ